MLRCPPAFGLHARSTSSGILPSGAQLSIASEGILPGFGALLPSATFCAEHVLGILPLVPTSCMLIDVSGELVFGHEMREST